MKSAASDFPLFVVPTSKQRVPPPSFISPPFNVRSLASFQTELGAKKRAEKKRWEGRRLEKLSGRPGKRERGRGGRDRGRKHHQLQRRRNRAEEGESLTLRSGPTFKFSASLPSFFDVCASPFFSPLALLAPKGGGEGKEKVEASSRLVHAYTTTNTRPTNMAAKKNYAQEEEAPRGGIRGGGGRGGSNKMVLGRTIKGSGFFQLPP